ncbi:MAG TPA: polyhydroxyalkanoate synthesis regulator DNA-binding domain-containing protein [Roseiflexaceae bacterium]|nr:polyhydroxyalkanoate synthesis regulator DNA-binding domain-containing protein [Roseiflexaceae bacterium]
MHSIKKYANRKLYHTNRKQYITLDGIAELIQAGEQVQVIDNETGEDITAGILAQVVLQARGRKSALPTHLLTDLIQAGGDTISGLRRSVWAAISGESSVDAEIRRRLHQLVTEGLLTADEGARMVRMLVRNGSDEATRALLDLPTSGDVARLRSQVETLAAAVEQLLAERERNGAPTPALPAPAASPVPADAPAEIALAAGQPDAEQSDPPADQARKNPARARRRKNDTGVGDT